MLRYKTEIAWFSRIIRHPAMKQSRSILTTQSLHGAEVRRPSHSQDVADFWSRRSAAWWPWPLTFEIIAHVVITGLCTPSMCQSLKFIALPVPKTWLFFSYSINRPGDLDLWLSTSKLGHKSPVSLASILPIFSFLCPSILDFVNIGSGTGQIDKQIDKQTDDGHQRLMLPPYGGHNN